MITVITESYSDWLKKRLKKHRKSSPEKSATQTYFALDAVVAGGRVYSPGEDVSICEADALPLLARNILSISGISSLEQLDREELMAKVEECFSLQEDEYSTEELRTIFSRLSDYKKKSVEELESLFEQGCFPFSLPDGVGRNLVTGYLLRFDLEFERVKEIPIEELKESLESFGLRIQVSAKNSEIWIKTVMLQFLLGMSKDQLLRGRSHSKFKNSSVEEIAVEIMNDQ
jgi:hypothetical protein